MDQGSHGLSDDDDRDWPWLDVLSRKHERGPSLSPYRDLDVLLDGRPVRVSIPDNLDEPVRLEIRASVGSDRILVLIAHHSREPGDPYERGIVMVASRRDDGPYVVHVWHELYPWALRHLGLDAPGRPAASKPDGGPNMSPA